MRKEISWTEKLADRIRREVSVSFFGNGLYWKERLSNDEGWNEDMVPSESDWERLNEEAQRRFQRHRLREDQMSLIQRRITSAKRGVARQQKPGPGRD